MCPFLSNRTLFLLFSQGLRVVIETRYCSIHSYIVAMAERPFFWSCAWPQFIVLLLHVLTAFSGRGKKTFGSLMC